MSKKTIFIAGGTDGIGFAFLKLCLRSGDYKKLYVLGRDFKKVTRLKSKSIVALKCNITDGDEMSSTLRKVKEPLDEFVNTIGTFHKQPIKDLKPEVIKKHFELNSTGNITLTTLMLPKLKKQFSQILVCLATLAIETRPEYSIQSATKVAYRFFLETLRKEQGNKIRVAMVHPSSVQTDIFKKAGDARTLSQYPPPEVIAGVMLSALQLPKNIEIHEYPIYNRKNT